MPSNSSPMSLPSYREVLIDEIEKAREILTFDFWSFELKPFFWPVDGGIRVPPDHWLDHRKKHDFQGPNCLCPLLWTTNEKPSSTEAQIVLMESGFYVGQYIAECPNSRCEYFVPLEQKYALYGIPVKRHAPREVRAEQIEEGNNFSPKQVLTTPRPLKRTYAVADLAVHSTIPRPTKWTRIDKLGRMRKPGLSEEGFLGLFVKCENCQRITTRDVFRYHLEGCEGYQHEGDTDTSESEQEI